MKKELIKKILRILIPSLIAGIILLFIYIIFSVPEGVEKQKKFEISKEKFCLTKKDCVPVRCSCECTSDDVINKQYRDKWEENNCEPGIACLDLDMLCPAEETACKYFMCSFKE